MTSEGSSPGYTKMTIRMSTIPGLGIRLMTPRREVHLSTITIINIVPPVNLHGMTEMSVLWIPRDRRGGLGDQFLTLKDALGCTVFGPLSWPHSLHLPYVHVASGFCETLTL